MSNQRIRIHRSAFANKSDWYVTWPIWVPCAILLLFGVFVVARVYWVERPPKNDTPMVALAEGQDLHLDPSKLSPRQLHIFEARALGQKVKFLVQCTPDKIVHVALASCKACYRKRDSHYARNGQMFCGECKGAMIFESKGQKVDTNHCALAEIPHSETDRDMTVSVRDVFAKAATLAQR